MKTLDKRLFVIAIFALIFILPVNSQNNRPPTRVEMVETIHDAYRELVKKATLVNKPDKSCFRHLEDILKHEKDSLHFLRTNILKTVHKTQNVVNAHTKLTNLGIELGVFNDYTDKAIDAFNKTTPFGKSADVSAFVQYFTGKSLDSFDDAAKRNLTEYYYSINGLVYSASTDSQTYSSNYLCDRIYTFSRKIKKWEYPNVLWDINIRVGTSCNCISNNSRFVNNAAHMYRATVKGTFTGKVITMGKPTNSKLDILRLACCSDKEEDVYETTLPEATGSIYSNMETGLPNAGLETDSDGDGIPDHMEEGANTEMGSNTIADEPWTNANEDIFDYTWAGDGFSITVGGGLPIGDEADFFGGTYGAEINYAQRISNRLRLLGGVGYRNYTGKETDFGFETEGESFIPITAKASYYLSDAVDFEAGLGYAISASGGDGGLTYSMGPVWKPVQNLSILLEYINIAFGEGSLGALMLSGRFSLSKK